MMAIQEITGSQYLVNFSIKVILTFPSMI
jgi:hypothetical protein